MRMFTGNMVTEAIPARVYSLYKIAISKKDITRNEIQSMMEPPEIYEGTSYFSAIFKTALELKIIDTQDNLVIPLVSRDEMKTIDGFRKYAISKLNMFEDEQFFQVTNVIVNLNEHIYKYSLTDSDLLNILSQQTGNQITAPMIRGWRFWAQFLGLGYMNNMSFLPNAYVFVKNVLSLLNLEKNKEYAIDDFMLMFEQYGKVLSGNLQQERNMNIALSSALRQLHDNNEIELRYRSDAEKRWILFPSTEQFNDQIASIVYKGVKK